MQPMMPSGYMNVPAGASDVPVMTAPGVLFTVNIITTGANAMQIFDNASAGTGTQIAQVPANPTAGQQFVFNVPTKNGITIKGSATNPVVVVTFG